MTRLRIDFAPASARRAWHRLPPALLAGGVFGLLACIGAGLAAQRTLTAQREREARLHHLQQRQAMQSATPAPVVANAVPAAQAAAVNAAVVQLNLPWRGLAEAVAAATPASVALLALEPDAKKRVLKLTAESKGGDGMIGYIGQLKEQDVFRGVTLTRHEVNEQDANRPIRFQLELQWAGP